MPGQETAAWAEYIEHLLHDSYGGNQSALARALGISQGTVSRWISGHSLPDVPSLRRISDLHGVPLLQLLSIAYDVDMGTLVTGGVESAVNVDPKLTPDLREHLLRQYRYLLRLPPEEPQ